MAAPAQSPLRRWKRFFGAFDSVDAVIEASDPVLLSRDEFRQIRGGIFEQLCGADDDHHAEQLCLVLDDVMAESLKTLKRVPVTPTVLATTEIAKSVRALQKHESEPVRVLANGIIAAWRRAAVQDDHAKVREATHKLDYVSQPKEIGKQQSTSTGNIVAHPDAATKPASKILYCSADRTSTTMSSDRVKTEAKTTAEQPLPKKTVEIKASDPAAQCIFRGDSGVICSEEKMEAAKRKFQEGYREAKDAKRQRRIQVVESPEMLKQRQKKMHPITRERSRPRCASSMVKKTASVTRNFTGLRTI